MNLLPLGNYCYYLIHHEACTLLVCPRVPGNIGVAFNDLAKTFERTTRWDNQSNYLLCVQWDLMDYLRGQEL